MQFPDDHDFCPPTKTRIEIAVSVETQVQTEDHSYSHALFVPTSRVSTAPPQSNSKLSCTFPSMSLPRANYDPRRVFFNPFPEISLGRHRRTIGIYLAGALVRSFFFFSYKCSHPNVSKIIVRARQLDFSRRCHPFRSCKCTMGQGPTPTSPRLFR
jgi:hypothetical protein